MHEEKEQILFIRRRGISEKKASLFSVTTGKAVRVEKMDWRD